LRYGIIYWEPTIWEHIKKRENERVEGWELATFIISNNTTPLDAKM